jgi:hypothetical protein
MPSLVHYFCLAGGLLAVGSNLPAAGYGFDVLEAPAEHAENRAQARLTGANGTWMRVRGLAELGSSGPRTVETDREGLRRLHGQGIKTTVLLLWGPTDWKSGVRSGGGPRMPLDLREAFERGRALGKAYGDLVDAWEIENEPDIGFVAENPEVYAAFHKTCYLGVHAGIAECLKSRAGPKWSVTHQADGPRIRYPVHAADPGRLSVPLTGSQAVWEGRDSAPRVLMAPLALPPGPYLERLWRNGFASYTDGFNYHYYGYAEDFTGVYRQFEDAVARLSKGDAASRRVAEDPSQRGRMPHLLSKPFPIFLTEYGYGLLDGEARNTVEGRVRQWRWFADVVGQIYSLKSEGPMAFVFNPYYEGNLNEFGLLMSKPADRGRRIAFDASVLGSSPSTSGSLHFTPADFGEDRLRPWMARIGQPMSGAEASPALAYLWDYAERHPYRSHPWTASVAPPSPVVIDFVADADMAQLKAAGGYGLTGRTDEQRTTNACTGRGRIILYHFGQAPITGDFKLVIAGDLAPVVERRLTLVPGERREIPVELMVPAEAFGEHRLEAVFAPVEREPTTVYATSLYPDTSAMIRRRVAAFDFADEQARSTRAALQARPLATGEPRLTASGRWLVSDGVRVDDDGDWWRFTVEHSPAEPLRPAMAELPLPPDFKFKPGMFLTFLYRTLRQPETAVSHSSSWAGDSVDVYFRAANGNLYQVWPRLRPTPDWTTCEQNAQDFTMAFFGRAALPWRFADNQPAALVFFLRSARLPFVFEAWMPQIVTLSSH